MIINHQVPLWFAKTLASSVEKPKVISHEAVAVSSSTQNNIRHHKGS